MSQDRDRSYFLRHARAVAGTLPRLLTCIGVQIIMAASIVTAVAVVELGTNRLVETFVIGSMALVGCVMMPICYLLDIRACQKYLPEAPKRIKESDQEREK